LTHEFITHVWTNANDPVKVQLRAQWTELVKAQSTKETRVWFAVLMIQNENVEIEGTVSEIVARCPVSLLARQVDKTII